MEKGKKPYERGNIEIIEFYSADIVTASGDGEMFGQGTPEGGWV